MAKKMRRILVLCLVLLFGISMIATPAMAKGHNDRDDNDNDRNPGGSGNQSSTQTEWYQVYVQGNLVASGQGAAGNVYYLGTHYTAGITASGPIVSWYITPHGGNAGSFGGTADLRNFITVPEGFTVKDYTIEESSVEGVNNSSSAHMYDNAIIKITIKTLYNEETGEEIVVPEETEPAATTVTVNHKYSTYDAYTGETVVDGTTSSSVDAIEGDSYTATAAPTYEGNTYTQQTEAAALTITVQADAAANVINIEYLRTIDTTPEPVDTKVTVIHEYSTHDVYTGETTPDGSVTEHADVTEGDSYTAIPKSEYNGNTYIPQNDELTITVKADEKDNVIVIEYIRTIDTTPVDYKPALSVIKTAAQTSYKEGETVTWTVTVQNISEYTAYDVVVTDDLTGDRWSIAALAPGAQQSFTATLENAPAGTIKNVAVVSWTDNDEIPDEEEPEEPKGTSDEEIVVVKEPVNYTPVLNIHKTADKAVYEAGETITWTITVKNVSEYTAYDVVVTDDLTGDRWSIAALAPGAEQSFTVTTENAAPGSVKNVAVASWTDGDEIPDAEEPNEIKTTGDEELVSVNDPAPENYTPVLSVTKTADKASYKKGEVITWTITVKNVSEYTAYNVVVVDELAKGYWTIDSLAPGAEQSFTATMENVDPGSVKNIVVVTWEDGDEIPNEEETNETTETSDEEVVTVEEPVNFTPVVTVSKTADKAAYEAGETITWTITVKNISEYTAYDVIVYDELTGDIWIVGALHPGAELSFTATTEDAQAGSIRNVATVRWEDGDEIPDEEEPEEPKSTTDDETVTVKEPEPPAPPAPPVNPDPVEPDPTEPEVTEPEPIEPEVPITPTPMDAEIEIPDEEVPLADSPKTGDISVIWLALSGISTCGMILLGKKREEDEE